MAEVAVIPVMVIMVDILPVAKEHTALRNAMADILLTTEMADIPLMTTMADIL